MHKSIQERKCGVLICSYVHWVQGLRYITLVSANLLFSCENIVVVLVWFIQLISTVLNDNISSHWNDDQFRKQSALHIYIN